MPPEQFVDAFELSRFYEQHVGCPPLIRLNGKTPVDADWVRGPRVDPDAWRAKLRGWHGNVGMLTGLLANGWYLVVVDGDAKVLHWQDSMIALRDLGLP